MGLIFPRLARNHIKNGYFPTDVDSLNAICERIDAQAHAVRAIDPCCGEGAALLHLVDHLEQNGVDVESFGIEIDDERATHAREALVPKGGLVAHADMNDVLTPRASIGLLFLNPPYGNTVNTADSYQRSEGDRHEKIFCRRWFPTLQIGGILVLVVPFYVLDEELSALIARNFERVSVRKAPEQAFRQAIIIGVKRRPSHPPAELVRQIVKFSEGHLDRIEMDEPGQYLIPGITPELEFALTVARIDPRQLSLEVSGRMASATLWPRYRHVFRSGQAQPPRRPLCALSQWHLALALAAGQISGLVSSGERLLLVKGDTFKRKETHKEYEHRSDGSVLQTTIATDRFVPVIKAIDMTAGSPLFGAVITIR